MGESASICGTQAGELAPMQLWIEQVQPRAAKVSERYRDPVRIDHYNFVCQQLLQCTGDEALAKAGYLHGLDTRSLRAVLDEGVVAVDKLLEGRRQLQSLDQGDPDVTQRLVNNFLPVIEDPRAALLLIVETLHHADTEGVMDQFCRSFLTSPVELPLAVPSINAPSPSFLGFVVAPICGFLGLWPERNLAEDLAMYHMDRARMFELLQLVRSSDILREIDRRLELVRDALREHAALGVPDLAFRWHHLASIDHRLKEGARFGSKMHHVSLASQIVVRCQTDQHCYEALGVLSLSTFFKSHHRIFEDTLARPKPTGYRAIRTTLLHKPEGESGTLIRVEILPASVDDERPRHLNLSRVNLLSQNRPTRRENIEVFAPDGRSVELPEGSRVLNFVSQIHGDLVALARGAFVNRSRADLLAQLQPGDIVQIDKGTELHLLPDGWEKQVPKQTVRRIRQCFQQAVNKKLPEKARQYLRSQLREHNVDDADSIEDGALDSFVTESAHSLSSESILKIPPESWLKHIGRFASAMGPQSESQKEMSLPVIDSSLVFRFVQDLVQRVKSSPRVHRNMIIVPQSLLRAFDEMKMCTRCTPTLSGKVVGKIEGRTLVVHEAGRNCGAMGELIEWRRSGTRGQHFVIEAANRVGLAAAAFKAVKDRELDIVEHCGTALGPSLAVFRFQLQGIASTQIEDLWRALNEVPGVIRVFRPGDKVPQFLEAPLPPRDVERSAFALSQPLYICGPAIRDDAHFYGRDRELGQLEGLMDECRRGDKGHVAFVVGPLKVGKTSLINRFTRKLRADDPACTVIYTQCPLGAGWEKVEADLRSKLETEIRARALHRDNPIPANLKEIGLYDLAVDFLQMYGKSLLFVIDEAMQVLARNSADSGILQFVGWAQNQRGVCVVLCGPKASIHRLDWECVQLYRSSDRIEIGRLTPEEVRSLFLAEKLGVRWINVPATVALEVHKSTAGNPYWCSLIAKSAMESMQGRTLLTYSLTDIQRAQVRCIEYNIEAFVDRFLDPIWTTEERLVVQAILSFLAELPLSGPPMPEADLIGHLGERIKTVRRSKVSSLLSELHDRGTLQQSHHLDARAWHFGPPILRAFFEKRRATIEELLERNSEKGNHGLSLSN
jgi:(p)ppGpp synthase/HD superfamily hydrolase